MHAQMGALAVGIVHGIIASHTVILDSTQRLCGVSSDDLQHHAWALAVRLATGQQAMGSGGSSGGHASGE